MRDWDQFLRFYQTFLRVQGSYCWAAYMEDPEEVKKMLNIPEAEWSKARPPQLFGWTSVIDRMTDLGDQLISQRAPNSKSVKFYPRPKIPAVEARKKRNMTHRDDAIEMARKRNRERRAKNN